MMNQIQRTVGAIALVVALSSASGFAQTAESAGSITIATQSDCTGTRYTLTVDGTALRSHRLDSIVNAKIVRIDPYPPAGASVVTIDVTPINPNEHASAILLVRDSANTLYSAPFVYRAEHVVADRDTLHFGYVAPGSLRERTITLTNPDTSAVTLTQFVFDLAESPFSVVAPTSLPVTIPGNGTMDLTVRSSPSAGVTARDTLTILTQCAVVARIALEVTSSDPSHADDERATAAATTLAQTEPNPVMGAARIRFALSHATHATLTLFDATGRTVATLLDEPRPAGEQTITFDAATLPSGIYHYRLTADGQDLTRSFVRR